MPGSMNVLVIGGTGFIGYRVVRRRVAIGHHLDNTRLLTEFGLRYRPFAEQVLQVINDTRRRAGLL